MKEADRELVRQIDRQEACTNETKREGGRDDVLASGKGGVFSPGQELEQRTGTFNKMKGILMHFTLGNTEDQCKSYESTKF